MATSISLIKKYIVGIAVFIRKVLSFLLHSFFLPVFIYSQSFKGRAIVDLNGNETGLVNMNPDPNGEPWIAGGMKPPTKEQIEKMKSIPEVEFKRSTLSRVLPPQVILIDNPEFPPVFSQVGGSCAQVSGVAYTYSYQLNVLKGVTATTENTRAYGFTHNFLNGGNNSGGSWYWDGWEILSHQGAPDITTFHGSANGGLAGTRWMNGAERWHSANDNRATKYEKIKIESMSDINKIKNWMYDLNGTDPNKKGGALVFAANAVSAKGNQIVSSGPFSGEALCTGLTKHGTDHGMTFAGYSDSVEGGALLLLNSWGTGWGTDGHVWVPYSTVVNGGLHHDEVWCVTVGEHAPKYEIETSITNSSRSTISIKTGFSSGNSESPDSLVTYGKAFNYSGGSHFMEGWGGSSTIDVSLDVSRFYDLIVNGEVTFFLQVINSGSYVCNINRTKLVDYSLSAPKEYTAEMSSASVSNGDTLLIPILFTSDVKRYCIAASVIGNGSIDPEGKTVVDLGSNLIFTATADKWHKFDSLLVDGENVSVASPFTLSDIKEHHNVEAYFSWDESTPPICSVTCVDAEYGESSPTGESLYEEGSNCTLAIIPEFFHIVDSVLVNGKKLGPLYSADFQFINRNHLIEPYFSSDPYGKFYPVWQASVVYGNGKKDTVQYNGHFWESNWWTKGNTPGTGGEWKDLGSVDNLDKDTIQVSHLQYISNAAHKDTLIITSYFIYKSDTVNILLDTLTDQPVNNLVNNNILKKQISITEDGKYFFAPHIGNYEITLFDMRGRELFRNCQKVNNVGMEKMSFKINDYSTGIYIIKVQGVGKQQIRKFSYYR